MTLLCTRLGIHRWRFVSMSDSRMIDTPPHFSWVCTLVERCSRCGLGRTRPYADVPKRVKVERASVRTRASGQRPTEGSDG